MIEYVPYIFGFVTGTVVWYARGRARAILSMLGVIFSGIAGTVISGEYLEGWGRLPLDVAQAVLGLGVATVVAFAIDHRTRVNRTP